MGYRMLRYPLVLNFLMDDSNMDDEKDNETFICPVSGMEVTRRICALSIEANPDACKLCTLHRPPFDS